MPRRRGGAEGVSCQSASISHFISFRSSKCIFRWARDAETAWHHVLVQGVRVEVRAPDRSGLLSDFTRMLREHGLSLLRVEIKRQKEEAIGTFFLVTDTGGEVRPEALCAVRTRVAEMGISLDVAKGAPGWPPVKKTRAPATSTADQDRPRSSLGSLLWSHLGKLSNNFGLIRS